jgi:hypothetical protein
MDTDNFFDGLAPEPETVPAVETQVAIPEPVAEPVAETPPAPAPEPEAKPDLKPEPGHIPITALLDEREKRKELERQLAALRETQQQVALPDPTADPYAYQQHLMQQVQQTVLDTRLNMSETAARRHYGPEITDAAKEWAMSRFQSNPAFQAEVLGNPDPYGYAIEAYQRDQIASQVSADDFKAFQAWKSAQAQIAAAPAAAPTPPAAVPRSIASTPSAGGVTQQVVDPESGYAAAIPG